MSIKPAPGWYFASVIEKTQVYAFDGRCNFTTPSRFRLVAILQDIEGCWVRYLSNMSIYQLVRMDLFHWQGVGCRGGMEKKRRKGGREDASRLPFNHLKPVSSRSPKFSYVDVYKCEWSKLDAGLFSIAT